MFEKYLYLLLLLGSFIVPFLFSFHPRLKFYKHWPSFKIATILMMLVFIPWDIIFTDYSYWGFNPKYLSGIYIVNLPIEEWLFFMLIPYSCIFTHYSLVELFPNWKFNYRNSQIFIGLFIAILIFIMAFNYDKAYTFYNIFYFVIISTLVYRFDKNLFGRFLPSFIVITIPFLIVNGVLTGSFIDEQVVWYNNEENLGLRFFTIPIEDFVYNFSMLITVLFVESYFYKKGIKFGK